MAFLPVFFFFFFFFYWSGLERARVTCRYGAMHVCTVLPVRRGITMYMHTCLLFMRAC